MRFGDEGFTESPSIPIQCPVPEGGYDGGERKSHTPSGSGLDAGALRGEACAHRCVEGSHVQVLLEAQGNGEACPLVAGVSSTA